MAGGHIMTSATPRCSPVAKAMTMTREEKVKLCKAIWNDAELIYEDDLHAFKHLPPYLIEPDPAWKTIQYTIRLAHEDAFYRKGLVRTPVFTMNWDAPSLDVDVVPLNIWKTVFDLVCPKQP
jgi:hypothetical protein